MKLKYFVILLCSWLISRNVSQPLIVASSVTEITVNNSQFEFVVRYDPTSHSIIGQRCILSSGSCYSSFTIKSSVTLSSLTVAAQSSVSYYNSTSYWLAGTLIVNNNYADPYLWIYQCLNFRCTSHSEHRYAATTIFNGVTSKISGYTGYYTKMFLWPTGASTSRNIYASYDPVILWSGSLNYYAMIHCDNLSCSDYYTYLLPIASKSQIGNVSDYDFFASEDPYVPHKYTAYGSSNLYAKLYGLWPAYNKTTQSFGIYMDIGGGTYGPIYNNGDPTTYDNIGEYGMNRFPRNYLQSEMLCNNFDTGYVWTTMANGEESSIIHFGAFNVSYGYTNSYSGYSDIIYYDGKNITKLRMLSVDYKPAIIWLDDHCVIQYLKCVNICCDAINNVVNLTGNLCNNYVSKSIRFQILDYESYYPTLIITALRKDESDTIDTMGVRCSSQSCSTVSQFYIHESPTVAPTETTTTTTTTTAVPTTSHPTPKPTIKPTPKPTALPTTHLPTMMPTSAPTSNTTNSHQNSNGASKAVKVFNLITWFVLLGIVLLILLLTLCSIICYGRNKSQLIPYSEESHFSIPTMSTGGNFKKTTKMTNTNEIDEFNNTPLIMEDSGMLPPSTLSQRDRDESQTFNTQMDIHTNAATIDVNESMDPNGAIGNDADNKDNDNDNDNNGIRNDKSIAIAGGAPMGHLMDVPFNPSNNSFKEVSTAAVLMQSQSFNAVKKHSDYGAIGNENNDNNDDDVNDAKSKKNVEKAVTDKVIGHGHGSGSVSMSGKTDVTGPLIVYNRGYGAKPNHFMVCKLFLSIFDIYTDVGYATFLYSNFSENKEWKIEFIVFISGIIISWMINFGLIIKYFKLEFSINEKFINWFYSHNNAIMIFLLTFSITDIDLLSGIFTSQIFGARLFYAPISVNGMALLKTSTLFSILIENIPQFIVQLLVKFQQHDEFTSLTLATLGMTIIDLVVALMNVLFWKLLDMEQKNRDKQSMTNIEQKTSKSNANGTAYTKIEHD